MKNKPLPSDVFNLIDGVLNIKTAHLYSLKMCHIGDELPEAQTME